ncbi:MAG TPA: LLM class flavin-dependent oxidoreductase [Stellaceae bacterium]|nr:LLM class flavin-dependent oxidoreductase [Stellaceae bacterium]
MKVGIFDHLDRGETPLPQFYEERLQLIEAADAAGIDSYHLAEHHWNPVGMAPLPGVFLGAAAARTTRIRLGPLAYALAFHNPLILAEEVAMLDQLSNGRFELGVGRGISPWELSMFGITMNETRDLFREAMDVMIQYFTSDRVTHRGARWQYYDVPVELKPVQKPFPPLWYGSSSGATRDYIASLGAAMNAGWAPAARIKQAVGLYREAWERNQDAPLRQGRPAEPALGLVRMVVIADSDAEAEALAQPAYERWYQSLEHQAHSFGFTALFLTGSYEIARRRVGCVIAGSPNTVRAELARDIAAAGVNYPLLQLAFGNLSHAQSLKTLELFTKEILPAIRTL